MEEDMFSQQIQATPSLSIWSFSLSINRRFKNHWL